MEQPIDNRYIDPYAGQTLDSATADPNTPGYEILSYGPEHMHIRTYYPAHVSVEQATVMKLEYDALFGADDEADEPEK